MKLILGALAAALAACSSAPSTPPDAAAGRSAAGTERRPPAVPPASPGFGASTTGESAARNALALERGRARWVPAVWSELPGWNADRTADAWSALVRSCERASGAWLAACASARRDRPADRGDAAVRAWLESHLVPWRVESLDGQAGGLVTGYFEPLVEASRTSRPGFRVALYAPPADLATRRPWWTRRQIESTGAGPAQKSLHGREIAWVREPLDALVLQIQGSGRLLFDNAGDGAKTLVRVAFAGHNDQPYRSVGRWLIEQGELRADQASWPAIRAWARQNPKRVDEMLWSNPRFVFFREEPLPDPALGPKGAQGVPLTPGRSIAVDPLSVPFGTPVWLDTTEPLGTTPLRRLAVAQDTGTAITGAVRADFFWGWGEEAENQAGRMKQPLRMWVLWPIGP